MLVSIETFSSIASGSPVHKAAEACYTQYSKRTSSREVLSSFSWVQELSVFPDRYSLATGASELIKQHWLHSNHSLAFECILINGKYEPSLSQLPEGVIVCGIDEARVSLSAFMQAFDINKHPLAFLNAVCSADRGVVIYIPEEMQTNDPIFVRHISFPTVSDHEVIFSPRIIVILGERASAQIQISHHVDLEGGGSNKTIVNGVTELFVGEGAELTLFMIPKYSEEDRLSWSSIATIEKDATCVITQNFLEDCHGFGWFDNTWYIVGEKGQAKSLVLVQSPKKTWVNNLMHHDAQETVSRQHIKSILYSGHFLFEGTISISSQGELSDAYQKHDTLLLTPEARVSTFPRLEIETDEVRASHGATVGPLDAQQIFYMRSRGMTEREAQEKLIQGFLKQGISSETLSGSSFQLNPTS
ncbi:Fe-S cluster assembly protein SufD [Candidatus Chlamydia corallus]|uniref:Fe-S cluster assembly protein SufD n=1 Tax=Candidatus Chlamydia corallus TaxID=2038470 RepID=UPI000C2FED1F|nr:Fe-S cluster assembly protein SufD [Candidatus Chlamydia corallus]